MGLVKCGMGEVLDDAVDDDSMLGDTCTDAR